MNLMHITVDTIAKLDNIANFSQFAILFEDLDSIEQEKKIATLSLLIDKLRQDGELVLRITDYSKILNLLKNNKIDENSGLEILRQIHFRTEPMELINFVISLEPKIILYKMIEDNNKIVLTLKRIEY